MERLYFLNLNLCLNCTKLQRPQWPRMSAEASSTPHTCAKDGAYIVYIQVVVCTLIPQYLVKAVY